MRFISTRGRSPAVPISVALLAGAAPDGGLYVPERPVRLDPASLPSDGDLPSLAAALLAPFFEGDALAAQLRAICVETFTFAAPLVSPDPSDSGLLALELFHGPTGAFKDFGARFLMACFDRLGDGGAPRTILAATSGDTGAAVGCAAEGRAAVRAVILYPQGRVSAFQEHQLGCWDAPVRTLRVDGDFDDCQRLAKAAFADASLTERFRLGSANSINVARLLPQMVALSAAALRTHAASGTRPGLIIPSGNLGHALSAIWARELGMPIGPILLATNANATLADWHRTGVYRARPSLPTLANAMDVGAPSNFERLEHLRPAPSLSVEKVDDAAIGARIREDFGRTGYVWCPHSATAAEGYARLQRGQRRERPWIAVATAHPFKFDTIVQPLIGAPVPAPPQLAAIRLRPCRAQAIEANLDSLVAALDLDPAEPLAGS